MGVAFTQSFCVAQPPPAHPQLWYWHHSYITNDQAVAKSKALINRALMAGYSGVVFWDSSFAFMSDSFWPPENVARLREVLHYAAQRGLKVMVTAGPSGGSNDSLQANPNWAEAQRVVGSRFRVDRSGRTLQLINSFPGLLNPDFENGETGWFDQHDRGTAIDSSVSRTGIASVRVTNAPGNGRFRQKVALTPWRQYHVRLFFKSQNFRGYTQVEIVDSSDFNKVRFTASLPANGNHDWTEADYMFNSQDSTSGYLYFGVWGGNTGSIWFDDIQIEETALVYVARRPGTPVKVYDPEHPERVFREGVDYNDITDARMTSTRTPFTDVYHAPTPIMLPPGTHLAPGQIVAIDSYSVFPIPGTLGVTSCLTDSGALAWQARNAHAIAGILPPGAGILMVYDEMRQMNSCATCRSKKMTAGELLAWSVGKSIGVYRSAAPGAPLYTWSDMFDPYHNAHDHYYDVEGTLAGSWKGVPSDVTILNWNLAKLRKSLTWFSGERSAQPVAHRQIIAGYYDSGNGAAAAQAELADAAGVPGVIGLMYTTWSDDYSQLESFARAARTHWPNYRNSLHHKSIGQVSLAAALAGLALLLCAAFLIRGRALHSPITRKP